MTLVTPSVDVRRSADRFATDIGWLDSKHSFSFGHHFDPANTGHGLLLVNNDDVVDPGTGFETHPHRDMEIVTWVMEGSLVHQDSTGHNGIIYPGLAQRMSAGRGILHSEKNDSWRLEGETHRDPVHFVQMWVVPDEGRVVQPAGGGGGAALRRAQVLRADPFTCGRQGGHVSLGHVVLPSSDLLGCCSGRVRVSGPGRRASPTPGSPPAQSPSPSGRRSR